MKKAKPEKIEEKKKEVEEGARTGMLEVSGPARGSNEEIEHNHAHNEAHSEGQQEKMLRLNMLAEDARQLEQQIVMIEQQVLELQILITTLDDIEKAKEKDEMLSPIGKNIFIRTELLSKELIVNVGAKTLVKKSIPKTKQLIENDIAKISELKEKLTAEFQKIVAELQGMY